MNKLAIGAALAALSLAVPGAALAQRTANAQIIVVDTGRILRECTACVAAQTQINGQINALRQRAQQLGQPLEIEAQSIQQAAQAARAQQGAARTAAENALQTRVQALQSRQNNANQEIGRQEQTLQSIRAHVIQQLQQRLTPIIAQVMNARNANIVLDASATLEHSPALEVTND